MTEYLGHEASERLPCLGHLIPMAEKEREGSTTPRPDWSPLLFCNCHTFNHINIFSSLEVQKARSNQTPAISQADLEQNSVHSGSFQSLRFNLYSASGRSICGSLFPHLLEELISGWVNCDALSRACFHVRPLCSEQHTNQARCSVRQEKRSDRFEDEDVETQKSSVTLQKVQAELETEVKPCTLSTILSGHPFPGLPVLLRPGFLSRCQ